MERMARRGGEVQLEGPVRASGSQVDWLGRGRVPTKALKRAVAVQRAALREIALEVIPKPPWS
jgi:hypothetical protein